jgi:hypothetical protein
MERNGFQGDRHLKLLSAYCGNDMCLHTGGLGTLALFEAVERDRDVVLALVLLDGALRVLEGFTDTLVVDML